jgi:protocatechuate 3,4-dioxygenase beta subunit
MHDSWIHEIPVHFRRRKFGSLPSRRRFLATLGLGGLYFTQRGAFAQALVETPAQTEGPYYPDRLPLDQDNDLLIIDANITPGIGEIAWISGRVLDSRGQPVRGALVEIWQADNFGSYIHSNGANAGRRDGNFQGYGRFLTGSSGEYLFRTIKPGLYPGRVRHVHYKVTYAGGASLTTQLYIQGETSGNDGVLNGIANAAQRQSVIVPWTPVPESRTGDLAARFDIVLGYTPADTPAPARPTLAAAGAVVQGATIVPGASPGAWITLFGDSLSATSRAWNAADLAGGRLPETLDGVSVRINNQPSAVYYVSPRQLNVLAAPNVAVGTVQATVANANGVSDPVTVEVASFLPGFFQFGQEYVAAVRADGAYLGPAGLIAGQTTVPARPGDPVLLFGTGFGPATPPPPSGEVFQGSFPLANTVEIRIDGVPAAVAFAGLVSPGLYQFNVTVPDLPDGDHAVTAQVGGARTVKLARLRTQRAASASAASPSRVDYRRLRTLLAA